MNKKEGINTNTIIACLIAITTIILSTIAGMVHFGFWQTLTILTIAIVILFITISIVFHRENTTQEEEEK